MYALQQPTTRSCAAGAPHARRRLPACQAIRTIPPAGVPRRAAASAGLGSGCSATERTVTLGDVEAASARTRTPTPRRSRAKRAAAPGHTPGATKLRTLLVGMQRAVVTAAAATGPEPASATRAFRTAADAVNAVRHAAPPARRVAHQGCAGAYTEVAALVACPGLQLYPCERFDIAFDALLHGEVELAVQPIENSTGGSILQVIDLLIKHPEINIVGETSLRINHNLCALPGTAIKDIKLVMSHPQALTQCDHYLNRMGPDVERKVSTATAAAAKMVSERQLRGVAAICSSRAAELYGLEILQPSIQDSQSNVTRFVVLSRQPNITVPEDERPHKTSLVFALNGGPGQLFKALAAFALRDIDLLKIESRPPRPESLTHGDMGAHAARYPYIFCCDFAGKLCDAKVQNAINNLQEMAPMVRVLGSFPMDPALGGVDVDVVMREMERRCCEVARADA